MKKFLMLSMVLISASIMYAMDVDRSIDAENINPNVAAMDVACPRAEAKSTLDELGREIDALQNVQMTPIEKYERAHLIKLRYSEVKRESARPDSIKLKHYLARHAAKKVKINSFFTEAFTGLIGHVTATAAARVAIPEQRDALRADIKKLNTIFADIIALDPEIGHDTKTSIQQRIQLLYHLALN